MAKDSHFKVLDIYAKEGKTQVTLLHLPDEQWHLFKNMCTNLDEEVVSYTRKRFDDCLSLPTIPELATPRWLERCAFPLGMSDEGIMFPLED